MLVLRSHRLSFPHLFVTIRFLYVFFLSLHSIYNMSTPLFISKKISLGGRNRVASFIAVAGVGCATAIMILTLAVSLGFKSQIKEKLRGFNADISVNPAYNYTSSSQNEFLQLTPELEKQIEQFTPSGHSMALRQPGILKTGDDYATLIFTAFDPSHDFGFERANILCGEFPDYSKTDNSNRIVISSTTASRLGLNVGDNITACFFVDEHIKARKFEIAGLYASNFGDYDRTVCYSSLGALQKVCGLDSLGGTAVEMRGIPVHDVPGIAEGLQAALIEEAQVKGADEVLVVDNITRTGAMYLNWLDLLDTNVVVIFIIMCCVATFTLVSSLFIVILNHISAIGILRAVGMNKAAVRRTFVMVAMRLVGIGLIVGNILAISAILVQDKWNVIPLDPEMYYLSSVPVSLSWKGIVAIDLGTAVLSWLILILPARLASSVSPAKTMRYD